jgi:uncharacterized RDD family membrane protein YckC
MHFICMLMDLLQNENEPNKIAPVLPSVRFVNFMIDWFILNFLATQISALLHISLDSAAIDACIKTQNLSKLLALIQPNILLGLCIQVLYYFPLEAATGATFSKLITRTIVVNEKGEKPSVTQIAVRTLCRLIPAVDFLSFLFTNGVGLHDTLSKTRVIEKKFAIKN